MVEEGGQHDHPSSHLVEPKTNQSAVIDLESAVALMPCEHHTGHAELQSRFSWAEFLSDEPTPTKRRARKPAQPTASLFEWALKREQQAGLAAAGG